MGLLKKAEKPFGVLMSLVTGLQNMGLDHPQIMALAKLLDDLWGLYD